MERVIRVKNMCYDDVCRVEDFRSFRRRNSAISADYARIYLQPLGESKRLKFAGGAAFGSTHIGYAMDLAADTLEGWGSTRGNTPADLLMPDGTAISPDWGGPTLDFQELVSSIWTSVGYDATRTGLRRLVYGNLAIYTDLGAVLWFCQIHEQRFNFFRDGRVDEFMQCFERFVEYVNSNHSADHHTFGPSGSFGSQAGGYLRRGLRALAEGNIRGSLEIVDHEQRNILQNFMYTLGPGVPGDVAGSLGSDREFANFMNALEAVQLGASSGYGTSPLFNGIRAQFSYAKEPNFLTRGRIPTPQQPLMFAFLPEVYGENFANPDVRTPWFKEVVAHWVRAENNDYGWPAPSAVCSLKVRVCGTIWQTARRTFGRSYTPILAGSGARDEAGRRNDRRSHCSGWCRTRRDGSGIRKRQPAPLPVLEIDMKTHLADAMAASTYDLEGVRINPGDPYQQITLTAFRNGRDGHYLLRLRDGAQVATIPYFPIYGNLFVSGSLLQELDLRFYNFDQVTGNKRPDMAGRGGMNDAVATRPEDDIAPIAAIYRQLDSFGWARFQGHCFHNRFPDSEPAACPEKLRFDPASGQTLENLLTRYIAEVRQASAAQDYARLDRIKGAVLGVDHVGWNAGAGHRL